VFGVIYLKDTVKQGMIERFRQLRDMGIRTVMITGDNPLTAKAIAEEAGVDDFLAEATPQEKVALIRREQRGGHMVAMTGDGTNDAPALAQACPSSSSATRRTARCCTPTASWSGPRCSGRSSWTPRATRCPSTSSRVPRPRAPGTTAARRAPPTSGRRTRC
jgi:hypothetical protein